MHRDQLSFATLTPYTDFLITSSVDGVVKFWKKVFGGIDFVKEFKAHSGEITSVSVSADGRSFATAGDDNSIKIFDVITFGMTLDRVFCAWALTSVRSVGNAQFRCYPQMHMLCQQAGSVHTAFSCLNRGRFVDTDI